MMFLRPIYEAHFLWRVDCKNSSLVFVVGIVVHSVFIKLQDSTKREYMGLNSSRGEPGGSAQVKGSLQITVCVRSSLAHDHPLEDLS